MSLQRHGKPKQCVADLSKLQKSFTKTIHIKHKRKFLKMKDYQTDYNVLDARSSEQVELNI